MEFHEDAFKAAAKITAAVAEEAEISLDEKGAEKVAAFFKTLYKNLRATALEQDEKKAAPGSFEVYADAKGEYRFRLKAANGQVIAVSEGYKKKDSCLNGVDSVIRSAPQAAIKEV